MEILNVVCNYLEYNCFALQYWDHLLHSGVTVWGVAAADAHRRAGNFYSSTGPHFQQFAVVGHTIRVWCSPAVGIRFMTGDANPAFRVRGETLMEAEYTPRPGDPYVRVEVVDAQMGSAWSQPFFIDPDWRQ